MLHRTKHHGYGGVLWLIGPAMLATCCLALLAGCQDRSKQPESYKFGVILPLTGSGADWGQGCKRGIDLALEELNAAGGLRGKPITLAYEDSQTDAKTAVAALRRMIDMERVPACIVDMISSNVLAMAPIANENKIVILSPGASAPELQTAGPYVFRNWPSDTKQGSVGAQFAARQLKWRTAGVLYINNSFGDGLKAAFTEKFGELGGKVTFTEFFEKGVTDVRPQVAKLKAASMDGLYLLGYPAEFPVVLKQLREAGVKLPILSTVEFDEPKIVAAAGLAADGVIFSAIAPSEEQSPETASFKAAYKAKYNAEPGVTSDVGYDSLKMIVQCAATAGYSGEAIRGALATLKDYHGAAGITSFNTTGDVDRPYIFKVVRSGKFQRYNDSVYNP